MRNYLQLPIGDKSPHIVHAIVEIPAGESNKYEYDKSLDIFKLDRNLHSPVHYPGTGRRPRQSERMRPPEESAAR